MLLQCPGTRTYSGCTGLSAVPGSSEQRSCRRQQSGHQGACVDVSGRRPKQRGEWGGAGGPLGLWPAGGQHTRGDYAGGRGAGAVPREPTCSPACPAGAPSGGPASSRGHRGWVLGTVPPTGTQEHRSLLGPGTPAAHVVSLGKHWWAQGSPGCGVLAQFPLGGTLGSQPQTAITGESPG